VSFRGVASTAKFEKGRWIERQKTDGSLKGKYSTKINY
jgi:hypothetical protein